jgi:hypothetical protein
MRDGITIPMSIGLESQSRFLVLFCFKSRLPILRYAHPSTIRLVELAVARLLFRPSILLPCPWFLALLDVVDGGCGSRGLLLDSLVSWRGCDAVAVSFHFSVCRSGPVWLTRWVEEMHPGPALLQDKGLRG